MLGQIRGPFAQYPASIFGQPKSTETSQVVILSPNCSQPPTICHLTTSWPKDHDFTFNRHQWTFLPWMCLLNVSLFKFKHPWQKFHSLTTHWVKKTLTSHFWTVYPRSIKWKKSRGTLKSTWLKGSQEPLEGVLSYWHQLESFDYSKQEERTLCFVLWSASRYTTLLVLLFRKTGFMRRTVPICASPLLGEFFCSLLNILFIIEDEKVWKKLFSSQTSVRFLQGDPQVMAMLCATEK